MGALGFGGVRGLGFLGVGFFFGFLLRVLGLVGIVDLRAARSCAFRDLRLSTGWGPLVISRVIRALNWVIRTLS